MGEFALEGILILVETALLFAAGFGGLVASIVLGLAKVGVKTVNNVKSLF